MDGNIFILGLSFVYQKGRYRKEAQVLLKTRRICSIPTHRSGDVLGPWKIWAGRAHVCVETDHRGALE